jgi:hypothetical protein
MISLLVTQQIILLFQKPPTVGATSAQRRWRGGYIVDTSFRVNTAFLIADLENFFSFSVTCFLARRRLAPRPEAMTGL